MAIIEAFAQNLLILVQEVDCNYKVQSAADFLDLHDQVRINVALGEASDLLVLTNHAHASLTISVSALNTLTLSQSTLPRVINVEATSYLILAQEAKHEDKWPLIQQTLTLVDEATCVVAHGTYDTLVLEQSATYTLVKNVTAASSLSMVSKATVYIPDKMWIADPTLTVNAP